MDKISGKVNFQSLEILEKKLSKNSPTITALSSPILIFERKTMENAETKKNAKEKNIETYQENMTI